MRLLPFFKCLIYILIRSLVTRDETVLKIWLKYYAKNGRNFCLIKSEEFLKMVRVGFPNKLRGELWEVCSGSIYNRFSHPNYYEKLLLEHEGKTSFSTEEIEKDLNR